MEAPVDLPLGPIQQAPSRPEPDVMVLKGPDGTFDHSYPQPADVVLVVEVSSDSRRLREDREGLTRYAYNGIPCVWIVNLAANVIEIYSKPTSPETGAVYEKNEIKHPGETITVSLDGVADIVLDVAALLA